MLDSDAAAHPAALDVALSAAIAAHCGVPVEPAIIAAAITPRTRLVVLTRPHNPTGAVIDGPTLAAIAEIAERASIHVLVDEVYLDTLGGFFGHPQHMRVAFGMGAEELERGLDAVPAALDAATHLEIARRCPARSAAH